MDSTTFELVWYEIFGDKYIDSILLKNMDLMELKKVFSIEYDEAIYYSYEVKECHLDFLQQFSEHKINLSNFAYFVEPKSDHT
jgi:hypothetical protein